MKTKTIALFSILLLLFSCKFTTKKNSLAMDIKDYIKGTYAYDAAFFAANKIETIELSDQNSKARVLLIPSYQGRVMTSSANGNEGKSFGWINYDLIESGIKNKQFNPVGGEERFWMGPEGGPNSIYFKPGKEQVFANWVVPPVIDTEPFNVKEKGKSNVTFTKSVRLVNASGSEFNIGIERNVSLLSADEFSVLLGANFPQGLNMVVYQSENMIKNIGGQAWTKENGLLSIWMLCMFNPSPTTTVFIPYKQESEGVIVNDNYFGKVPSERLKVEDGIVYFQIDGKFRSKIGLPPTRATELCGSYDSKGKVLTLVWCSLPNEPKVYVNSQWGEQVNPYAGDVINSYNDGPVEDGSIMGPFYEIETSSPAAELLPGEVLSHIQRIAHIQGDEQKLNEIVQLLFNVDLNSINTKF